MKQVKIAFLLVSLSFSSVVFAGELDRTAPVAPQGVIVRTDATGKREVFKAELADKVSNDQAAADVAAKFVTAENRIAQVLPGNELDHTTSNEAWYYWPSPYYYNSYYSYSYYNSSYNYYPCYNWSYGNYSYYYYWYRF